MGVFVGKVVSYTDENDGGRIKVFIERDDRGKAISAIDEAFPLLPKVLGIKPKIGESVIVLTTGEDSRTQRYYIGPIISQMQKLNRDLDFSTLSMLKGGRGFQMPALSTFPSATGSFADEEEIALYSRKNSDVILSDNDVRIRCGSRVMNPNAIQEDRKVVFNKEDPAYIKLNYYEEENGLNIGNGKSIKSSANVVADYINLLSTNGNPYFDGLTNNEEKLISDETLKEIVEKAHPLPWGDKLVEFLQVFVKAFNSHTHVYHNLPPCPDISYNNLQTKAMTLKDDILSKNIRIN